LSRSIYPSAAKLFLPGEQAARRDRVMRKANTGTGKVVRDDALIVAVDRGMEMNRGYCL
jgi:hypothetical protein